MVAPWQLVSYSDGSMTSAETMDIRRCSRPLTNVRYRANPSAVESDPEAIASFVRSRAPGTVRIGVAHPTVSQRMTPSDPALAANEQGKLQHLDAMRLQPNSSEIEIQQTFLFGLSLSCRPEAFVSHRAIFVEFRHSAPTTSPPTKTASLLPALAPSSSK